MNNQSLNIKSHIMEVPLELKRDKKFSKEIKNYLL
jgi:hypothetical protein